MDTLVALRWLYERASAVLVLSRGVVALSIPPVDSKSAFIDVPKMKDFRLVT